MAYCTVTKKDVIITFDTWLEGSVIHRLWWLSCLGYFVLELSYLTPAELFILNDERLNNVCIVHIRCLQLAVYIFQISVFVLNYILKTFLDYNH